jgi:lipopolysaccharide export system permease protein
MRSITRYVLREIGLVFLVTLVSLTLLLLMVVAIKEAIAQGVGAAQIAQMVPYLLPNALMFALPGSILYAVSSVYGRMSAANEITALKSAGISPLAVLWPALALATLLSLAEVWLNDLAMSWGYQGMQRVVIDSLEDIAYGTLRAQKHFSRPQFSITVKEIVGRTLVKPVFAFPGPDGEGTRNVRAESAELRSHPGSGKLTVKLYNITSDAPGQYVDLPDLPFERDIELAAGLGGEVQPARMALREFTEATARQEQKISELEERMAAKSGFQMLTGDFEGLPQADWNGDADRLQNLKFKLYRMQTEPPRRWANGFSCLCFALVGATMAIRRRNSDALTSFFLCFLPILLIYYPLLMFGADRAKAGAIHPSIVWLGNAALVAWGLWLLRRVMRY